MPKKVDYKTVQVSFRCPVPVLVQLDELCRMSGVKRSEFFVNAIISEYDKIQGNPQLKKMMEQMRQIAETMKEMTVNSGSVVQVQQELSGQIDLGLSVGAEHGGSSE